MCPDVNQNSSRLAVCLKEVEGGLFITFVKPFSPTKGDVEWLATESDSRMGTGSFDNAVKEVPGKNSQFWQHEAVKFNKRAADLPVASSWRNDNSESSS